MSFLDRIREKARKKIIYTEHALDEMIAEEEMISKDEVRHVIFNGEIIEDYPDDKRGHSCLIFTMTPKMRPVHVVCSPKEDYLGIITTYVPGEEKWESNFRIRKESKGS